MYGSTCYYAVLFDKMPLHPTTVLNSYDLRLITSFVDEFHTNLFYIVYLGHFNITALELSLSNSIISVSKVYDQMQYRLILYACVYMHTCNIYNYINHLYGLVATQKNEKITYSVPMLIFLLKR